MRVLFTTTALSGHFHPLVPLARALAADGHDVAFACARSFCPQVEASGFPAFPAGRDGAADPEFQQIMAGVFQLPPGPEQARHYVLHVFFGIDARRMAPDLVALGRSWRPDVIVRESMELGGAIAAERLDIPHATVEVGHWFDVRPLQAVQSVQLDRARAAVGLPPDPGLTMLDRYLQLSFSPPALDDPAVPIPPTLHRLRADPFDQSGDEALPQWLTELPQQPTVYVTLGTEMNRIPGIFPGVLQTIIAGLQELSCNIIVTVGRDQDPAALRPQPPHVHVARYIPHSLLFPRCDVIVSHGGHNTILTAVQAGAPVVVIPITADQPENAERCTALGLGRVVPLPELQPAAISAAVREVLGDTRYRANVLRLRTEIAALPGLEHGVRLLEQLVATRTPIRIPA